MFSSVLRGAVRSGMVLGMRQLSPAIVDSEARHIGERIDAAAERICASLRVPVSEIPHLVDQVAQLRAQVRVLEAAVARLLVERAPQETK